MSNLNRSTFFSFLFSPFFLLPLILSLIPPPYSLNNLFPISLLPTADASLLDQCTVAAYALFTDPRVNACIPSDPVAQFLDDNSTSITPKLVNDTVTTFCTMPFCNSATVSLMETTIDQNCVKSLDDRAGFHALYGFASLYIPFKQGICQRYEPATNGTFCITIMTESLNDYAKKHKNKNKKASGWEIFWNTTELGKYVDGMPKSMLCTPCNKAMINPMNKFVSVHQLTLDPEVVAWVRSLQEDIQKHCGPQFVDAIGPPPDDVATPRSAAISSFSSLSVISLGYPYVISIISGFALLYCYSSLP